MVAATRKMNEFKDEILAWIDEKFNSLKTDILTELEDQIKNELAEVLKEEFRKREELESTVSVLQEHVHYYQNQLNEIKRENEELEQYGRRLCVRIEGIPSVGNEASDEVLDKVMSLMAEAECDIPEVVIDRAHRVIVRFSTFRHRTKFYRSRSKLKNNVKVKPRILESLALKLDLTGSRYTIFTKAIETGKQLWLILTAG